MSSRYNLRRRRSSALPEQRQRGSPLDQIPRKSITQSDIDVHRSYVNEVDEEEEVEPVQSVSVRRWKPWGREEPLNDPERLPKFWHMREDDLDPDDVEGQIVRCHERLRDNIMPHIFEQRLKEYEAMMEERRQLVSSEPEGLSWETLERVKVLREMEQRFVSREDEDSTEQLPNIRAILQAYRSKQLVWHPKLVTYWSNGQQLCEPRPFDWDEFEVLNQAHGGHKGFWREGLVGPGSQGQFLLVTLGGFPGWGNLVQVHLALRLPGYQWWVELPFMYDTGASCMAIYHGDLNMLMGPPRQPPNLWPPVLYTSAYTTASGVALMSVIEVEVTLLDSRNPGAKRLTRWTRMECTVKPGFYRGPASMPRLDGPFLRSQLYVGSAPPDYRKVYVATSKAGLNLPARDLVQHPPPAPPFTKKVLAPGDRLGPHPKGFTIPSSGLKAMPLRADLTEVPP